MSISNAPMIAVVIDTAIIGKDAVLKACYWFSRDYHHQITPMPDGRLHVTLAPKNSIGAESSASCQGEFLNTALDFELRSMIEAKTANIKELILAKAFAASGVLEDTPQGILADPVEAAQDKPEGLFKILNSGPF